jgi:hypothetical protein
MNWQTFKALYELYETGKIRNRTTLAENAIFKYHAKQTKELLFTKRDIQFSGSGNFKETFEKLYLDKFRTCRELLDAIDENTPQCRLDVEDILILKGIKQQMDDKELEEIREQIIAFNETRRGVSLMFFRNEKHLESSETLERAVKKILKIDHFTDERDLQYMYILQCNNPQTIVLCENLHFLRMPEKFRQHNVELWYAGGKNIEKLIYTETRDLPIYYICDWDYDGLDIYRLVKEKIATIRLLTPDGAPKDIIKTEHKSLWSEKEHPEAISGLSHELFSPEQKQLIQQLIIDNAWIVEESNNLISLIAK